jgi:hypothetical protein
MGQAFLAWKVAAAPCETTAMKLDPISDQADDSSVRKGEKPEQ